MLAVCQLPAVCAAPKQRMFCSMWCFPSSSTGFSGAALWDCEQELALVPLLVTSNLHPHLCSQPDGEKTNPKCHQDPHEGVNIYKDQDYKSAFYISQPSGLMPAEIWNCLYCMYGHLGYCFQNYFWQRSVEVEEQCLKEEIILSLKGLVLAIRIYYYKAYLCHSLSKKNSTSIIPDNCRNN